MKKGFSRREFLKNSTGVAIATSLLPNLDSTSPKLEDAWQYASNLAKDIYQQIFASGHVGKSVLCGDAVKVRDTKNYKSYIFYSYENDDGSKGIPFQLISRFDPLFKDNRIFVRTLGTLRSSKPCVRLFYERIKGSTGAEFLLNDEGLFEITYYPPGEQFSSVRYEKSSGWKPLPFIMPESHFPHSVGLLENLEGIKIPWEMDYNRESWKIVHETGIIEMHRDLNKNSLSVANS